MAKLISLFNHKGGVSKTTTTFNVGWSLAKMGLKVLLVDADPQCNLTSLALSLPDEAAFENLYTRKDSNDIYSLVQQMKNDGRKEFSRTDSIANIVPTQQENLFILPGHLEIEEFSTQITLALQLAVSPQFGPMMGIPGYLNYSLRRIAEIHELDYVLIDMAPSLSGLNEVLLMSSDYFLAPCSPDFFSEIALKNLSRIIPSWYGDVQRFAEIKPTLPIPCSPVFLGIIQQNYRPRKRTEDDDPNQPTSAFRVWIERVRHATKNNLVPALNKLGLAVSEKAFKEAVKDQEPYNISLISDFNSLIALSQMVNKPIFELSDQELQARGQVLRTMRENVEKFRITFDDLAKKIKYLTS